MKNTVIKKSFSIILAIVMLFTMVPAAVFAADSSLPMIKATVVSADFHAYRSSVVTVTFLDKIDTDAINGAFKSWDVSANANSGEVMAWMNINEEATAAAGANRYDVYIGGNGGVSANPNSNDFFYNFVVLEEINGLENFDTSTATSFKYMFEKCKSLKTLDLSSFDTSNVTSFVWMFIDCVSLESINLSGWDTSSATSMDSMFKNCYKLQTLDISSFNTANVTDMNHLFYNCHELAAIYVGDGWNIDKVTKGSSVFNCCYALPNYDPSNSKTDISYASTGSGGMLKPESEKPVTTKYTVTYKFVGDIIPEGVTTPGDVTYEEGDTVTVAENSSAEHYIFSGWSTGDVEIENGKFVIYNDVEFVGSWTKLYKVEYQYADGILIPDGAPELPETVYYKAEDVVHVNDIFFVEGYTFEGWTTDDAAINELNKFLMPENDVVIVGFFKKPVESIEINGEIKDIILDLSEENNTAKIEAVAKPDDATFPELGYESDNEEVVTVDKDGTITAIGNGKAEITVYSKDDPGITATVTVTVKTPVTDIEVTESNVELYTDDTYEIEYNVLPGNAADKEVTFESSDETVVKVDENGNVTAVGEGTAVITIISKDDNTVTEKVTVTVKNPVTEIIAPDSVKLELGDEENLGAKTNEDASNGELSYETSDPHVVRVTTDGEILATGVGTATITITSVDNPSIKKEVTVTVVPKTYKVTYEIIGDVKPNGVTAPDEATYSDGSEVTVEDVLTANGYTFSGWSTNDVTDYADGKFIISNDVHFVGSFEKIKVDNITVENDEIELVPGGTDEIIVTVTPDNAAEKGVTYKSSDESVVKVDENGKITAVGEGTATITVTSKDDETKTVTVTVTVKTPVNEITASPSELEIVVGNNGKIEASVNEDATNKNITYKSNDESVVTVDENGNVTAVGVGETTIEVASEDKPNIKVTVKVTVVPKSYKVTYEIIGDVKPNGVTAPVEATYYDGTEVTVADVISANGYTFYGWTTDDVEVKDGKFVISNDVHFVGSFSKNVSKIEVTWNNPTLEPGDELVLPVTVKPNDATEKGVTFESSDETVVKVDENGKITAVGEGTATVTVTSKENPTIKEEITVTVEIPVIPVSSIKVDKSSVNIAPGDEDKITVTVNPENATDKSVTFTSSDETVVKVDKDGNITAVSEGTAEITVTSNANPSLSIKIPVKVETPVVPVKEISVDKTVFELTCGDTDKINVTVNPDNATDKGVTFTSSDEAVVKIDADGTIHAVGNGTATVVVSSVSDPKLKVAVVVSVTDNKPTEPETPEHPGYTITVPGSVSILEGQSSQLNISITPDDGSIKPVFTSSDESIVKVDANGTITGIKAGTATISVDFGGGDVRVIPVTVAPIVAPVKRSHYICFGKTDGIGWYEVSVNGGDFFPQGPNSTLEVEEGSILVIRVQDMWIDDEFDFYVNGTKVLVDDANTITVQVDGYMLIGALSMDVPVPDVDESLTIFQKILNFFSGIINWFKNLFKR